MGAEGESEKSFAAWLQRVCERENWHCHLNVFVAGGGDGVQVVEHCIRKYEERRRSGRPYRGCFILLDSDRLEGDRRAGRDPRLIARRARVELVFLEPNLEGVLLRLHPGHEARKPTGEDARRELEKAWPGYRKPPPADELDGLFGIDDLRRAARHDENMRRLIRLLEAGPR